MGGAEYYNRGTLLQSNFPCLRPAGAPYSQQLEHVHTVHRLHCGPMVRCKCDIVHRLSCGQVRARRASLRGVPGWSIIAVAKTIRWRPGS